MNRLAKSLARLTSNAARTLLFALFLVLPFSSHAALVEGQFTGTVNYTDISNSGGSLPPPSSLNVGDPVRVQFAYDSNTPPSLSIHGAFHPSGPGTTYSVNIGNWNWSTSTPEILAISNYEYGGQYFSGFGPYYSNHSGGGGPAVESTSQLSALTSTPNGLLTTSSSNALPTSLAELHPSEAQSLGGTLGSFYSYSGSDLDWWFFYSIDPSSVQLGLAAPPPPPKKPPQWLKNLALSYEDLFKRTADDLNIETTLISAAAVGLEKGALKALEYAMKKLAEWFGLKTAANIVNESHDPTAINTFFASKGVLTSASCISDLSEMNYETALTLCGANATGLFMGDYLAPKLHDYGVDPLDPDYQSIFPVALPVFDIGNPTYQSLIDEIGCAGAYLNGVNVSYDRYSGAYAAGDQASQALQLGAIDTYMAQYGNCMGLARDQLTLMADAVRNSPELNAPYDPSLLVLAQDSLRNDGFAPDALLLLQDMGLDSTQIDQVKNDILGFDPLSISGNLSETLSADASAFGRASSVPTPGTLLLVVCGLMLIGLMQHLRTASEVDRGR